MGRIDKVNELMKREIGQMLQQDMQDPQLLFVSVTHVDVSKDLRHARVNFSFLGDAAQVNDVLEKLQASRGYIRKLVGKRIRLRYTPEIEFCYDQSIEYSARIEQTIHDLHTEKENTGQEDEPS